MTLPTQILAGFVLIILVIGSWRGDNSIRNYFELKDSALVLEKVVQDLEDENAALAFEIEKIEKSPSYALKVLREKYHVTAENESIIFFAD